MLSRYSANPAFEHRIRFDARIVNFVTRFDDESEPGEIHFCVRLS